MTGCPAILASRAQALGLPASAVAVMFGVVLATNADRFGVTGAGMGAALVVAGAFFGARLFRGSTRPAQENRDGDSEP